MQNFLFSENLPSSWQKPLLEMLPGTPKSVVASIAHVPDLHIFCLHLVLGRIEDVLDDA